MLLPKTWSWVASNVGRSRRVAGRVAASTACNAARSRWPREGWVSAQRTTSATGVPACDAAELGNANVAAATAQSSSDLNARAP
ncbi:MAG: hypothetical protein RIT45_180 [Pseudomonadota bacterium]